MCTKKKTSTFPLQPAPQSRCKTHRGRGLAARGTAALPCTAADGMWRGFCSLDAVALQAVCQTRVLTLQADTWRTRSTLRAAICATASSAPCALRTLRTKCAVGSCSSLPPACFCTDPLESQASLPQSSTTAASFPGACSPCRALSGVACPYGGAPRARQQRHPRRTHRPRQTHSRPAYAPLPDAASQAQHECPLPMPAFLAALRGARCGSAAGPSGATAEHLHTLLDCSMRLLSVSQMLRSQLAF